jgi:hypothetical protein
MGMTKVAAFQLDTPRGNAGASQASAAGAKVFYRYRSANGRTVIVDSLSQVPSNEREHAERVELEAAPSAGVEALAKQLDWPSFAAGFGLALALATVVLFLTRGSLRWLGSLLLLALVVGGSGAYFGWLRRSTGQDSAVFASPATLIDDAHRAVEKMKEHEKEQGRVIQDIQREAK